ncbi:ABC transporter ATP-binding protein, partial [Rubrivivax gelatinosus]|nr:ABC transporter ATP-binding protein [Rubrivivax gelatinosus]
MRGLEAGYGVRPVLHGVDLDVGAGEIVALLGRNGSGRSTTAKALMGLLPARGSVRWRGAELLGHPAHEIARAGLGYVPESRDVFPTLSVNENLRLGERPRRGTRRWTTAELLARFPRLAERAQAPAGVLSGGEQQMLTLARTLVGDPDLLIVDEPTEGLAPQVVAQVAELLAE